MWYSLAVILLMKINVIFLAVLLLMPISCYAVYNKAVEKNLSKEYRSVTYLAHGDCYLVMSKKDRDYYGVCNSSGDVIIPANYKKISFEKAEDGSVIMFAMTPNFKAESQGNIVYSMNRGKIMDMGKNEPQYIPGGYISSYGKSIYNLAGNLVLDCQQTSVQPMRHGKEITGYKVATRILVNNIAQDELLICGPTFNKLFTLEGAGYLWKVEELRGPNNELQWVCSKSLGGTEFLTLRYSADGQLLDDSQEINTNKTQNPPLYADSNQSKAINSIPAKTENRSASQYTQIIQTQKSSSQQTNPSTITSTAKKNVSDVDANPPVTNIVADKTFAVIISNENYSEVEKVQYALNDGEIVSNYFEKTLGIPKSNIRYIPDATLNKMRIQLSWLKNISEAFGKEAKVIFYYSGHGVPDEQSKNAYLMPVDGYHSDMSTNLSINQLYEELASLDVSQVIVFMDACFSGSQRGDNMLVAARGVKIKSRANAPKGKLVVFSAAQGDETAYPLEDQGHGMFTYYFLKKLRDSGSNVTLGELSEYITSEVKKASLVKNGKLQTPSTSVSIEIESNWKERSL